MVLDGLFNELRSERLQFLTFIGISFVVATFFGALSFLGYPALLLSLFGGLNPLIGLLPISLMGFFIFVFLISKGYFSIYKKGHLKGYLYASGLAALFGLIAILVDLSTRIYSADINVLFPKSLLFYPAMGYVAEIIFQLLPLTLILIVLNPLSEKAGTKKIVWSSMLVASLPEPIFQILVGSGPLPLWFAVFELTRIFVVVLSQLTFFKRYDFVTMYWFRIVYYIFWHIAWGYWRLGMLF